MNEQDGLRRGRPALAYVPVLRDGPGIISDCGPNRVLVVGDRVPPGVEGSGQLRALRSPTVQLPRGVYRFDDEVGTVMLVVDGASQGPPTTASWDADDSDPMIAAFSWCEEWWEEASEVPQPLFAVGATVQTHPDGSVVSIRGRQFDRGRWWYFVHGSSTDFPETSLRPPDLDDDPHIWAERRHDSAGNFAATITRAKLTGQLTDTVYSFRASRTIFRPYQFRPVLKLLESGKMRLLIADEVGLGKTIEAGLVWSELDARRQADRVLVVTPSNLVEKWRGEMDQRFGFELSALSGSDLDELLEQVENDRLPTRLQAIASLERLRSWPGLERLAQISPRFDLVIVDEAHAFRNMGTQSHALGALLSDWADALIFLSATPLNLGNDDLFNLLGLLSPGDFDDRTVLEQRLEPNAVLNRVAAGLIDRSVQPADRLASLGELNDLTFGSSVTMRPEFAELKNLLGRPLEAADVAAARRLLRRLHALEAVVTRTRKAEVDDAKTVREPRSIEVQWTDEETAFYESVELWQIRRAQSLGIPLGFAAQMPLRLASTCLPATKARVLNWGEPSEHEVDEFDLAEELDDDSAAVLIRDNADRPPAEVVEAARALGDVDTKFDLLVEHLKPIVATGRRVLLFSFSRPTLAYLQRRLAEHCRVTSLHGGIDRRERPQIISAFRRGEFDVLLASRVASEGLDFEFCSVVVNYDLPWNPMEVEQRIGRADRFGQQEEKILILNFHTPGTIESKIIERVHTRIGVFTSSIGELEPILRSEIGDLKRMMFDFSLTDEQKLKRIDEKMAAIEEQRTALEDVERASAFLASVDGAEIAGLETELLRSGRYVGQLELVHLLAQWIDRTEGASWTMSDDGVWLRIVGSAALDADLRRVQAQGERSSMELERLGRQILGGIEIQLCLDPDRARETGSDLLSSTHPLVRAALASRDAGQSRFTHLQVPGGEGQSGTFFVLISLARWRGLRPSNELWANAVSLDTLEEHPTIGDHVLASLANGSWKDGHAAPDALDDAVDAAMSVVRSRRMTYEARKEEENRALVELRRVSVRETHQRKCRVIQQRIETARSRGSAIALRLGESQLASQERRLAEIEDQIREGEQVSMDVEHLAVCVVEVLP